MKTILNGRRVIFNGKGNVEQIVFVWTRDDFIDSANQQGHTLTDQQIDDAMSLVLNSHDCTIGISWETVEQAIDEVVQDQIQTGQSSGCHNSGKIK